MRKKSVVKGFCLSLMMTILSSTALSGGMPVHANDL